MKLIVSFTVLMLMVGGVVVVGCGGSPSVTCQTQTCNNDAPKSFQACSHVDGTVSYDFGGMSCDCKSGDQTGCNNCAASVANYCNGGGIAGSGGTGGGGSGGGAGGGPTCTAVFSGAFSSTYMPCAMLITVTSSTWTIGTAGNALPGTNYDWQGLNMAFDGTNAAPGTYDQTMAKGTGTSVSVNGGGAAWLAGAASGSNIIGTMSVTITSLGPATTVNGSTLYQQPHGSVTSTLNNQATMMADETLNITF